MLSRYSALIFSSTAGSLLPQNQNMVDDATIAQIDTLILDSRKKLNQIIG